VSAFAGLYKKMIELPCSLWCLYRRRDKCNYQLRCTIPQQLKG